MSEKPTKEKPFDDQVIVYKEIFFRCSSSPVQIIDKETLIESENNTKEIDYSEG
jgi:hypothetical protein